MTHPNSFDRLQSKMNPHYLYPGQYCLTLAKVNVAIIHKIPAVEPYWKVMDYLYLKKGSCLKYLGLAKDLKFTGDVDPAHSVFEAVSPLFESRDPSANPMNLTTHLAIGDIVAVVPSDRRFIAPAPGPTQ